MTARKTLSDTLRSGIMRAMRACGTFESYPAVSLSRWCRENKLIYPVVWRFMQGKDIRLDTADKIAEALGLQLKKKP